MVYKIIAPVPHFNSPTGITNVELAKFDELEKAQDFRKALLIHSQLIEIEQ